MPSSEASLRLHAFSRLENIEAHGVARAGASTAAKGRGVLEVIDGLKREVAVLR